MNLSKLTGPQLTALPLLASGVLQKDVAAQIGVSESTVSGWKQMPQFVAALNRTRKDALEGALARLQSQAPTVIDSLIALATTSADLKVRLEATRLFLESVGMVEGKFGAGIGSSDPVEIETVLKMDAATKKQAQQLADLL